MTADTADLAQKSEPAQRLGYVPVMNLWLLRAAVLYLLGLKLAFMLLVPPTGDEAYYWAWGQHLQLSYLDHSPLVGWGAWLANHLLGWSIPALRLAPLLTFSGSVWMIWVWSKRLAPANAEHYFWACLAIFLASPLMNALTSLLYPDHVLIFLSLLALHFLAGFLADWREGRHVHYRALYFGAVMLGLAGLAKYNAAFLAAGLVGVILLDRKLWPILRSPHLYLAGLLTVALVSPVFIWNAEHGFPTLKLHALQRFQGRGEDFQLQGVQRFLRDTALYYSPFLIWPWALFLFSRRLEDVARQLQALGRVVFVISGVILLGLSSWHAAASQVAPHWHVLAAVPFLLAAPLFLRWRWLFGLHLIYGTLIATVAFVYFFAAPLATDALNISDNEAVINYGQEQLADAARAAKEKYGADFYAAALYPTASRFAFGLGTDKDVLTVNDLIEQFDYWREPADYAGKTAIIIIERGTAEVDFGRFFDSLELIGPVQTTRYGRPLRTYTLYLGRGYHPGPVQP